MKKYAKIINDETKAIIVGVGTNEAYYKSIGMELMDVQQDQNGKWYLSGMVPPPEPPVYTVQDYDEAMENYLKEVCIARGYTTREPSDYKDSTVQRWKQDAEDYIVFRDKVLTYALNIQNTYIAGGQVPTLQEFKENFPKIIWTYSD